MAKSKFEVNATKYVTQNYVVFVEASSVDSAVRKAAELILQGKAGEPTLEAANVKVRQVYSEKNGEFTEYVDF